MVKFGHFNIHKISTHFLWTQQRLLSLQTRKTLVSCANVAPLRRRAIKDRFEYHTALCKFLESRGTYRIGNRV